MDSDTTKPKRKRAPKKAPVFETVRQELTRKLDEQKTRTRSAHRHHDHDLPSQIRALRVARDQLGRRIALELDHNAATCEISYECSRCGASGSFDLEPIGAIFGPKRCRARGLVLDGTETLDAVLTQLGYTHATSRTPGRKDISLGSMVVYQAAYAGDVWAWLRERGEIASEDPLHITLYPLTFTLCEIVDGKIWRSDPIEAESYRTVAQAIIGACTADFATRWAEGPTGVIIYGYERGSKTWDTTTIPRLNKLRSEVAILGE